MVPPKRKSTRKQKTILSENGSISKKYTENEKFTNTTPLKSLNTLIHLKKFRPLMGYESRKFIGIPRRSHCVFIKNTFSSRTAGRRPRHTSGILFELKSLTKLSRCMMALYIIRNYVERNF